MKKIFITFTFIGSFTCYGQNFLNGDFEINTAVTDQINLTNTAYNDMMANSVSFGTVGDVDIITTTSYCQASAQQGSWYVALTGGGTDAISLELSAPLITGEFYTVSFYDRWGSPPSSTVYPFQIGQSTTSSSFDTVIYTAPNSAECIWTLRTFTFMAPNNGQFITVKLSDGGVSDTWCHIDNFTIQQTTSINSYNQNSPVQIFPNPFTSQTTITFPLQQTNTIIKIINSLGEEIRTINFTGKQLVIDKAEMKAGIYFVQTTDEQKHIWKNKVVIQ
jgi:hypothetical protein